MVATHQLTYQRETQAWYKRAFCNHPNCDHPNHLPPELTDISDSLLTLCHPFSLSLSLSLSPFSATKPPSSLQISQTSLTILLRGQNIYFVFAFFFEEITIPSNDA
jgi:hypothetical protein